MAVTSIGFGLRAAKHAREQLYGLSIFAVVNMQRFLAGDFFHRAQLQGNQAFGRGSQLL